MSKSIQDLDLNTFLVYDRGAKLRPFHSIYKPYNNRGQWSVTHALERKKNVMQYLKAINLWLQNSKRK